MKKIIYYITDHGLGHATRSIAIIRKLQEFGIDIMVRNSSAIEFLKKSLPSVEIVFGKTDVGPTIKENGITIDQENSKKHISRWLDNMGEHVSEEMKLIKSFESDLFISDISIMPLIVAEKLNKKSIAISNFTWYDVLKFMPKNHLEFIKESYSLADYVIKLPIGTKMNHFKEEFQSGYISRIPTDAKDSIREKLKIAKSEFIVTFALGGSKNMINCKVGKNIRILSMSSSLDPSMSFMDVSNWIEGQDIVNVSDLVFCKCGYGLISECLTTGTPFCYVMDSSHQEQLTMSQYLTERQFGKKIELDEINDLTINEEFLSSIPEMGKQPNDLENVVKYIVDKL